MSERRCEFCGAAYEPYRDTQRFCCRTHSDAWFQRERKRGVELLRKMQIDPIAEDETEDAA
jgi:hypothetical protein